MTVLARIHVPAVSGSENREVLASLSKRLLEGAVIAYPTETLYGLGCSAFSESSVRRVRVLKGTAPGKAFILLIPGMRWLEILASANAQARALAQAFWPGPLTLVLDAKDTVPPYLRGEHDTIAVRLSSGEFVQGLFRHFDEPLVSTSANPEGSLPAATAAEVLGYFSAYPAVIDVLVEYPVAMTGTASTIVSLAGGRPSILREGPISRRKVWEVLGRPPGSFR
jgi:L-threonylcarbamoyladenylate synthase